VDVIGDIWQTHGYKDLDNWVDGIIGVGLLMGLYYYKCWVDHKFKNKNMKEKICKLVCKLTFGKVCLGWCKDCSCA